MFVKKDISPKKILDLKNFLGSNKIIGQQISLVQKNIILVHKNLDPEKFGPKSLVKIRSETAEILLIQTNVAWTNVTMAIEYLAQNWVQYRV